MGQGDGAPESKTTYQLKKCPYDGNNLIKMNPEAQGQRECKATGKVFDLAEDFYFKCKQCDYIRCKESMCCIDGHTLMI